MSSHVRNGRRDNRSRFPRRQEWIPRTTITPTAVDANSPSTLASSSSEGNGGLANQAILPIQANQANQGNTRSGLQSHNNGVQRRHVPRVGGVLNSRDRRKEDGFGLPQLVQEIQDKLLKGTIECMICYDMVRRSAPVWSCSSCFSIFHLHCIKKWARAPTSIDLSAEKNQGFNWRCPGCQSVQLMSSKEIRYTCFCGKRQDPPSDPYLTPHSCGEPCGRPLDKESSGSGSRDDDHCPHRCVLQCHPGPCPPCKAFAPPRMCPCGKKVITTRCSDQKSLFTCGQRCGKLLKCLRHHCDKTCHAGPCDSCEVLLNASCFCNKKTEVVVCGDMAVKGQVNLEEDGIFSCSEPCAKLLACGNHVCKETCHPGGCGDCDLLPRTITSCYCGKSSLQEERHSCLDPIPTCSQICEKTLPCGVHSCKETCHPGSCAPCRVTVTQKCRCGSTSRSVECFMQANAFTCDKPCGRKKSCGRHRCSDKCCPLSNSNSVATQGWDPHLCSKPCEKKLRCGQHDCSLLCHSGHCPPCPERIFTDLTCACGRSSIPPPLPCGTPPPSCQYPCSVPQPCGHVSSHSCHFGDCPPCPVPIPKECIGGHVVLRNIPCGSKDIRCNKLCGKTRQCGMHACLRTCHPPPCDSATGGGSCGQTCGAPRRDCRHTCTSLCHPYSTCPDVRCEFPVTIACGCGRITATVPCDAGGYSADSVLEASAIQKLPVALQPVEASGKKVPLGQRKLMCDDECLKAERKKVLADAFGVTSSNLDALHFGGENPEVVGELFRRDSKWVLAVEERCKMLVLGRGKGTAVKVHVFCPMLKEKRDAVRLIAERWKLSINAAGWEPKRFIVIHATPKSKVPSRVIGAKGLQHLHPPSFDPLVDMDPRLVVALFDLPGDADVSALVLRFGGECELVWLNDKNALAVFSDPARAATAMRRLDHGSVYSGAAILSSSSSSSLSSSSSSMSSSSSGNAWGSSAVNPWKKAVVQESSWGAAAAGGGAADAETPSAMPWKVKEGTTAVSAANRWSVLEADNSNNSSSGNSIGESTRGNEALSSNDVASKEDEDVVEDWDKAFE